MPAKLLLLVCNRYYPRRMGGRLGANHQLQQVSFKTVPGTQSASARLSVGGSG